MNEPALIYVNSPDLFSKGLTLGMSQEEVTALIGTPSNQWNDGIEAVCEYHFETHDLSFTFEVTPEFSNKTSLRSCEIDIHYKIPAYTKYSVYTLDKSGLHKEVERDLTYSKSIQVMSQLNHTVGIATHWVAPTQQQIEE